MAELVLAPQAAIETEFEAYERTRSVTLRDAIVLRHMSLVRRIAKHHARDISQRDDLEQVGSIGLIKAVERFDPELGVPFEAYARTLIAGEISHYLRDLAPAFRMPRWYSRLNRDLHAARDRLLAELQREPTNGELAGEMNITIQGVQEILRLRGNYNLISLSGQTPADQWHPKFEAIRSRHYETFRLPVEDRIVLDRALEKLAAFERQLVYLFFYLDLTQTEIARRLGSSQRQISRALAKVLQKLKSDFT